jgi:uncharacterized protein (UPF0248 family)
MKYIREILNKFKWHPNYEFSRVQVIYIDRLSENKENFVFGDEIEEIGHKFLFLKHGKMIPLHRIIEIQYNGETVWRKKLS